MNETCKDIVITTSTSPKKEPDSVEDNNAGSSPGRASPEANCPICLGKPENKSFTDSCLHQFCFTCLLEWSKVKAECPLCKQGFKSIIHNVRSIEDYEQYYLSTTTAEGTIMGIISHYEANQTREPFRYRTTAVSSYLDYFVRLEEAISHHVIPPGPSINATAYWQRRRQRGTSDFRRNIYQQGLWVQRTSDVTGRVRDCSPEFYRANPAQIHRLVPWLNRELNVLLYENSAHIQHVMSRILDLIVQVPIRSPGFAAAIAPYFGRHTEHFIHEFHSFATSPFDLVGYDRHANYVGRSMLAHRTLASDSHEEGSDSDVQVLEESRMTTLPSIQLEDSDSDDCIVLDSQLRGQPEVITLDSDDEDLEVVQIDIQTSNQPSQSSASTSQTKTSTPYRPRLKRNWFKLSEVQVPTTSSSDENFDVSISIQSASPTRSDTSSSSWTPGHKHPKKAKKKKEKSKKKKCHRIKTSKSKVKSDTIESDSGNERPYRPAPRKRKVIENDSEYENLPPSIQPPQTCKMINNDSESEKSFKGVSRQQKSAIKYGSPSDSDNGNLFIATSSSTSSDESEYKPRLRSVVIKSEPRAKSPTFSHSSSRSENIDHHYPPYSSNFLDMPSCSNSRIDSYRSSYDGRSRSYSTSSLDKPSSKKRKHYKRKSKRDKI